MRGEPAGGTAGAWKVPRGCWRADGTRDAGWRASLLAQVAENARLLALAEERG
jgi:hypothetical protein